MQQQNEMVNKSHFSQDPEISNIPQASDFLSGTVLYKIIQQFGWVNNDENDYDTIEDTISARKIREISHDLQQEPASCEELKQNEVPSRNDLNQDNKNTPSITNSAKYSIAPVNSESTRSRLSQAKHNKVPKVKLSANDIVRNYGIHLERQQRGREIQRRKRVESLLDGQGSKWTPTTTQPIPFRLSKSNLATYSRNAGVQVSMPYQPTSKERLKRKRTKQEIMQQRRRLQDHSSNNHGSDRHMEVAEELPIEHSTSSGRMTATTEQHLQTKSNEEEGLTVFQYKDELENWEPYEVSLCLSEGDLTPVSPKVDFDSENIDQMRTDSGGTVPNNAPTDRDTNILNDAIRLSTTMTQNRPLRDNVGGDVSEEKCDDANSEVQKPRWRRPSVSKLLQKYAKNRPRTKSLTKAVRKGARILGVISKKNKQSISSKEQTLGVV